MKILILIPLLFFINVSLSDENSRSVIDYNILKYFKYNDRLIEGDDIIRLNDKIKIRCYSIDSFLPYDHLSGEHGRREIPICINVSKIENVKEVLILIIGCDNIPVFVKYHIVKNNVKSFKEKINVLGCSRKIVTVLAYVKTKEFKIYANSAMFMSIF